MSDERLDLAYVGRTLRHLTDEVAGLRDDMPALTAIVHRVDNSHTRLLTEIRAIYSPASRLADRVRQLEAPEDADE